jgi:ribokinase
VTPTVVVVGSINVDLVFRVDRLPAPGETVIGGVFDQTHGGKGANQAVAAARLGARTVMVGVLGADDLGDSAREQLRTEGIELSAVGTGSSHTGVAGIVVDAAGENLIAVASGSNTELTGAIVGDALRSLDAPDAVVLSVLEIPDDAVAAAAEGARDREWPFVLNPAPARPLPAELVALCDVLTPNEHEVTGLGYASGDELLEAGARAVVVTRGARGTDLLQAGKPVVHRDAFPATSVDTTGAGDAFSGALAYGLASGRDLPEAVEFAAAAAALSVGAPGARAGMPTRSEVEALLGADHS